MKNGIANTFVFIVDLHDYMNIYILKVLFQIVYIHDVLYNTCINHKLLNCINPLLN